MRTAVLLGAGAALLGAAGSAIADPASTDADAAPAAAQAPPSIDAPRVRNPDPWEPMNRPIHGFNQVIDKYAFRPVAVGYDKVTPRWMRTGIGNFFTNLFYPATIVNQFLQGKPRQGSQDFARFVINTTLGWGGVLDVASGAHLPLHDEDFGQTLGVWGVPPGPYLVLPVLGPSTVRDAPTRVAEDYVRPFRWYDAGAERYFSLGLYLIDKRAGLLPYDQLLRDAYDPYVFIRDAFLQRREYAVRDGNVPSARGGDDSSWAEEALREDEAAATEEGDDSPGQATAEPAPASEAPAVGETPANDDGD